MSRPGRPRAGHPRSGHRFSWPPILPWLALVLLACEGAPAPERRPDTLPIPHPSLEAVEAAARDQIEEARRRLDAVAESDGPATERAEASGHLGRLYQGYGFDEAAMAAYSNSVALAPDDFRWLYHLGALELDTGSLDRGSMHLERALEARPGDASTLRRLGQAALDEAAFDRAVDLYTQAVEGDPACAAAQFGIGLAELGRGDPERAVEAFERTLEIEPGASQTYRPLAMAYRDLGDLERARLSLARAGTAVPSCPDPLIAEVHALTRGASALFERATLAELEGRTDAAVGLAREAVAADPDHAAARRFYGQLLTRTGSLPAAIEQFEIAAGLEPDDRRTHMLLGRAYRDAGRLEESVEALQRAVHLDPEYTRARVELALSQMESGQWRAARAGLEEGLTRDPANLDLRVQLARAMAATGELEASRRELEAVVAQDPRQAGARLALGTMLLEAGEIRGAEEHLTKVLEAEASEETYALCHYHLAGLAAARGQSDIAARHLATAVELAPTMIPARLALAEAELASARFEEAARQFAAAAALRPDLALPLIGEARALLGSGAEVEARGGLEAASERFPRDAEVAHLLARVLATATEPSARDGSRSLELATALFAGRKTLAHGETVAMALAELGRYDEAVAWQQRLIEQARADGVEPRVVEALEARLQEYARRQPARQAW